MGYDKYKKQHKEIKGVVIILFAIAATLGVNAYLLAHDRTAAPTESTTQYTPATTPTDDIDGYTLTEVAAHNTPEDCWMAAYGMVYDMTPYVAEGRHPGGQGSLTAGCGEEVTESFDRIHSTRAKDMMEDYVIGVLLE